MHMLASMQVFHPLGKKNEKKTGISSLQALLNFNVSAAIKFQGQPQPSHPFWMYHMMTEAMKKPRAMVRDQREVLTRSVHIYPTMSCPHLKKSS